MVRRDASRRAAPGMYKMPASDSGIDRTTVRGMDDNSLLRLYDRSKVAAAAGGTRIECNRAASAVRMVIAEVRKRGLRV